MTTDPCARPNRPADLAGPLPTPFAPLAIKMRLDTLCDRYCNRTYLDGLIADLPAQLARPAARPWATIAWESIDRGQILDIAPEFFLAILAGAAATEAPIRGYSQASRQYLDRINPQIARFVGGTVTAEGTPAEPGLWEKEERRHAPALRRLYRQLSNGAAPTVARTASSAAVAKAGDRLNASAAQRLEKFARPYFPGPDPRRDLFRHGLHRIVTEYGAACLYLWLAARTTGALQQVCLEILQDELNHLTKFWCFGCWLYERPATDLARALWHNAGRGNHTFRYMQTMLAWSSWTPNNQVELAYAFAGVLLRLLHWSACLQPERLHRLLATAAASQPTESNASPTLAIVRQPARPQTKR
ncbi:MAG: ferritin-like domain-containing protein [Cyanobacteria bacterium J06641_5]